MIQLSDLTKSFGDRTLLEHVTWQIGDGDRVGLSADATLWLLGSPGPLAARIALMAGSIVLCAIQKP